MTLVSSRMVTPDGQPVADRRIVAYLLEGEWVAGGESAYRVTGSVSTETDENGDWSLELIPNSDYVDSDTYYIIAESRGDQYAAVVPAVEAVELYDILVDPETLDPEDPALPGLYLARSEVGVPGGVAPLGIDGRVPAEYLPPGNGGGGVSDHGGLTGLGDDDHPQYHTDARGDARYYTKGQVDALIPEIPDVPETPEDIGAAPAAHEHAISDVTGLQTALAGKAATTHDHDGVYAPALHSHSVEEVSGLLTELDGLAGDIADLEAAGYLTEGGADARYSPIGHSHTGVYSPVSHTHAISGVTGLQAALDSKAATAHNHDGTYSPVAHTHGIADITDFDPADKADAVDVANLDSRVSALEGFAPVILVDSVETIPPGTPAGTVVVVKS